MTRRAIGESSPVDSDRKFYRKTINLTPRDVEYLENLSANNHITETDVIRYEIRLMQTLGKLGVTDQLELVSPAGEKGGSKTVMLPLDLTQET